MRTGNITKYVHLWHKNELSPTPEPNPKEAKIKRKQKQAKNPSECLDPTADQLEPINVFKAPPVIVMYDWG